MPKLPSSYRAAYMMQAAARELDKYDTSPEDERHMQADLRRYAAYLMGADEPVLSSGFHQLEQRVMEELTQ